MSREREAKLPVEAADARRRLAEAGAEPLGEAHDEENWVLDSPERTAAARGCLLPSSQRVMQLSETPRRSASCHAARPRRWRSDRRSRSSRSRVTVRASDGTGSVVGMVMCMVSGVVATG